MNRRPYSMSSKKITLTGPSLSLKWHIVQADGYSFGHRGCMLNADPQTLKKFGQPMAEIEEVQTIWQEGCKKAKSKRTSLVVTFEEMQRICNWFEAVKEIYSCAGTGFPVGKKEKV